jgi:hypothetical protein
MSQIKHRRRRRARALARCQRALDRYRRGRGVHHLIAAHRSVGRTLGRHFTNEEAQTRGAGFGSNVDIRDMVAEDLGPFTEIDLHYEIQVCADRWDVWRHSLIKARLNLSQIGGAP